MAASHNSVQLMGNLTQDPQERKTKQGVVFATCGIAVNEQWVQNGEKQERVDFFDFATFNGTAKALLDYKKKGDPVFIEGKLRYRSYQDQSGQNRTSITVEARNIQFLAKGNNNNNAPAQGAADVDDDFEDDIPF